MTRMAATIALVMSACRAPGPHAPLDVSSPEAVAVVDRGIAIWRGNRGSGCGTPGLGALHLIEKLGDAAVPVLFERAQSDAHADVRGELLQALAATTCCPGRVPGEHTLPEVRSWWTEHASERREERALAAWEACGDEFICGTQCEVDTFDAPVVARLESWLSSDSPRLRRMARYLLWTELRSPEVLTWARETLARGDLEERNEALQEIASLRIAELEPELLRALDKDRPLAETAASVAATMRWQRAAPLIATLADDSVGIERGRLLRSLWLLDSSLALPRLEALARSPRPDERTAAYKALWEASEPQAHAILLRGLKDPAEDALQAAVSALSSAREIREETRLLAARTVLPRAAPATESRAGDATWAIDDLLWRLALQSGWPPETAPRVERFSEENLRALVAWWEARLAARPPH